MQRSAGQTSAKTDRWESRLCRRTAVPHVLQERNVCSHRQPCCRVWRKCEGMFGKSATIGQNTWTTTDSAKLFRCCRHVQAVSSCWTKECTKQLDALAEYAKKHRTRLQPRRIDENPDSAAELLFHTFYRKEMCVVRGGDHGGTSPPNIFSGGNIIKSPPPPSNMMKKYMLVEIYHPILLLGSEKFNKKVSSRMHQIAWLPAQTAGPIYPRCRPI